MPRQPRPWHDEARKMRNAGRSFTEIARLLNVSYDSARDFLTDRWQKNSPGTIIGAKGEGGFTERHAARAIPPKIDPMPICRMFAAGKIDRATMSKMLRGEA